MKKRVFIGAVVLGMLVAVVVLTVLLATSGPSEEEIRFQELQTDFIRAYGTEVELIGIVEPEHIYVYVWDETLEGGQVIRNYALSPIPGIFDVQLQVELEPGSAPEQEAE